MGNAGYHPDTRFLKKMILDEKLIKVLDSDSSTIKKIKNRFNDIVLRDEIVNQKYNGRTYKAHSAWNDMYKALIWVNQTRCRSREFTPLAVADLYRPSTL